MKPGAPSGLSCASSHRWRCARSGRLVSQGNQRQDAVGGGGSVAAISPVLRLCPRLVGVQHDRGEVEAAVGILAALTKTLAAPAHGSGWVAPPPQPAPAARDGSWIDPHGRDREPHAARRPSPRLRIPDLPASSRALRRAAGCAARRPSARPAFRRAETLERPARSRSSDNRKDVGPSCRRRLRCSCSAQ